MQSWPRLLVISFHDDQAIWPLKSCTWARQHTCESHESERICPSFVMYFWMAFSLCGLVILQAIQSLALRRIKLLPKSSDPQVNKFTTGSKLGIIAFNILTWQWWTPHSDIFVQESLCCLICLSRLPIIFSSVHCEMIILGPMWVASGAKCEAVCKHSQTKWILSTQHWTYSSSNLFENSVMSSWASTSSIGSVFCIKIWNA